MARQVRGSHWVSKKAGKDATPADLEHTRQELLLVIKPHLRGMSSSQKRWLIDLIENWFDNAINAKLESSHEPKPFPRHPPPD